jgi:thiol:disulfide interchange protein DsbD
VSASRGFVTLKADITGEPTPAVAALRERLKVLGAPTIIFLDARGTERVDLRLTGFEKAEAFLARMARARSS